MVQGQTEKEARDFYRYYVHEKGDWQAATNLVDTMGLTTGILNPDALKAIKEHFIAGWGGYPLIGTPEQIVDSSPCLLISASTGPCSHGRNMKPACVPSRRTCCH